MSRRTILRGLSTLLLGALAAATFGYTWLQTPAGKRWLADRIETVVSTPERQLTIGTLDGDIPFAPTVADISLRDSEGTWLTLDRASIRLDPLALFSRVALFEVIDVGRVVMQRQPGASSSEAGKQPAERSPWPLSWPELPVDLEVERLHVAEVALGATVLGEAASLGVEGAIRLGDPGDDMSLDLAVVRTDRSFGSLNARLRYVPDTTRLVTKLRLSEPAGGMLSRLADLPALPALDIDLVADVSIDGLEPGIELPGGWLEPSTRVAASGSITRKGMIVVDSLTVEVSAARLSVEGTAEAWGADDVQLAGVVDVPDLSRFGPSFRGRLTGTGRLSGKLDDPAATARLTLTDSVLAGYPMSEMRLAADFEDLTGQPTGHVVLQGGIAGLPTRAAADVRFDNDGRTRVDAFVLQLSSLAAEGAVTLDDNHNASGQILLSITSLADLAPLTGETLSGTVDASMSLSQVDGRQAIDARVLAAGAGLPGVVTAGRSELRLQLSDALAAPVITAHLEAERIIAAGQSLERILVTAEGTQDRLTVAVDLSDELLAVETQGEVALTDGGVGIELASLAARHAGAEATLAGPALVTLAPEDVSVRRPGPASPRRAA